MAANNYFGFTHGGTQYGAATASAAYGGQTGYAVAPAATAATYGTQRAAATGYDTAYQAAAATQAAHAQAHAHAAAAAASAYDASKSAYYQQAAAAYPAAATPAYEATPTKAYQAPTYQNIACVQTASRQPTKPYYPPTYPTQTAYQAPPKTTRASSAYDAALYNAATMYVAQQSKAGGTQTAPTQGWKAYKSGAGAAGTAAPARRPKPPPKAQQLHYCDVCRISCAGPQTYKEHLEGQKHKKKEAAAKLAGARAGGSGSGGGGAALRCELCDVTCTGGDAYAAHVRGIKHQKVVKLHTMLGKPIPSTEPTKLGDDAPGKESPEPEPDVAPVGHDYIEELRGDDGKPLSFNCKLCDCKFNDPNAKEMHMKGRRHRLQYKKKVQPDLEVRVKPSLQQQRKLAEQKAARLSAREDWGAREWDWWPRRPDTGDDRAVAAKHAALYPPEAELRRLQRAVGNTERALKALSDALLSQASRAKPAKPALAKPDDKDGRDNQLFSFAGEGEGHNGAGAEGVRALKGVMRVGLLAKGLLLKGDRDVRLVVLCHDRPTITLLKRVAADLPKHLASVKQPAGEEVKYRVELQAAEGAVLVTDGVVNVRVSLTSAVMRDPAPEGGDDKDVLPRAKCLDALAALRHAKWFQARAANLGSCVVVLRVLRDMRRRMPSWAPLSGWALELLAGAALAGGGALAAGEALRRVLEAVAAGVLLEGGPGLRDPCEKETTDALAGLAAQAREDITASAQHALRQIAFRQIHKVLDMEPLPKIKHQPGPWKFPRKRRRSATDVEGEGKVVKTEDKMDTSDGNK